MGIRGDEDILAEPGWSERALLDALCGSVSDVLKSAGAAPSRVRVRLGQASIDVEWPTSAPVAGVLVEPVAAVVPIVPDNRITVCSPLVGTFYRAPEPTARPFVEPGDLVLPGQQVGIVEAMKLMNAVHADAAGRVVEILVGDGDSVEYGQPLLVLEPQEEL
jgi:acetyl-CoA carboxylase biotin carboxyl carrier protein